MAVLLAACGGAADEADETDAGPFGSPYEVILGEHDSMPDEPPALFGDTLALHVAYGGGCRDHDFELLSEVRADTAKLWLRHIDNGDDCEAWIRDRIELTVPPAVLDAGTIWLINPNGFEPFVLRWGWQSDPAVTDADPGLIY